MVNINDSTNEIIFSRVTTWNQEPIIQLYREAGWWMDEYDPGEVPRLISSSFLFVIGVSSLTHETVAMGRILSDGVIGIIQDMCVLAQYRRRGIGIQLLEFLMRSAKEANLLRLLLVAEPATGHFYKKSGFIAEKNQIFLLHNIQE